MIDDQAYQLVSSFLKFPVGNDELTFVDVHDIGSQVTIWKNRLDDATEVSNTQMIEKSKRILAFLKSREGDAIKMCISSKKPVRLFIDVTSGSVIDVS